MAFLVALIVGPAFVALEAWILMLLIGGLHHEVDSRIPAYGFWQVLLIAVTLSTVGAIVKGVDTSKEND